MVSEIKVIYSLFKLTSFLIAEGGGGGGDWIKNCVNVSV